MTNWFIHLATSQTSARAKGKAIGPATSLEGWLSRLMVLLFCTSGAIQTVIFFFYDKWQLFCLFIKE
jgi:hypothetical protein